MAALAATAWIVQAGSAAAFPAADPTNPGIVPVGADLAQPDVQDLRHQMQLLSGFASAGRGWTILPRISVEEMFNDNIFQVSAPRHWDFTTIVAPGVAVLGDLDRVQLRANYQPTLDLHLKEGAQNALTQQLNADGLVTVVPDLFFVDVRGVAGTQATQGGIGGLGGLGQPGVGPITANAITSGNQLGLSKQNRSQTTSFTVSPYMLYRFSDIGDGKLGISANRSSTAQLTGFAPLPFAGGDRTAQTLTNLEGTASFATGQRFAWLHDTASIDANQGQTTGSSGAGSRASSSGTSARDTATNRIDYAISHSISVYGTAGWEYIKYSGSNRLNVDGPTWGFGATYVPNQDSSITLGYGRQNGRNSLTFNGHYALTARTTLTGSYSNTIGTQLEQVANQLNLGAVGNNGSLVNSQTGAPLFVSNNALGLQSGVFRFSTLTFGATTVLDRDVITLQVSNSVQTQVGTGVPSTSNAVKMLTVTWQRQFTPVVAMNASASYSVGTPSATLGSTRSLAASVSLQYTLSATVSAFARYSYLSRETSTQGSSFYEDLAIVGVTKQF